MGTTLPDLPVEIRSMIYQQLFPNTHVTSKPLIAQIRLITKKKTRLVNGIPTTQSVEKWRCWGSSFSSSQGLLLELPTIMPLLLTSRFFHQEISRILYQNILPTFISIDDFHQMSIILGFETRKKIHTLSVPMANSTVRQRRQLISACTLISCIQYWNYKPRAVLQTLILTGCDTYPPVRNLTTSNGKPISCKLSKPCSMKVCVRSSNIHTIEYQTAPFS